MTSTPNELWTTTASTHLWHSLRPVGLLAIITIIWDMDNLNSSGLTFTLLFNHTPLSPATDTPWNFNCSSTVETIKTEIPSVSLQQIPSRSIWTATKDEEKEGVKRILGKTKEKMKRKKKNKEKTIPQEEESYKKNLILSPADKIRPGIPEHKSFSFESLHDGWINKIFQLISCTSIVRGSESWFDNARGTLGGSEDLSAIGYVKWKEMCSQTRLDNSVCYHAVPRQ